jgi:Tol biopolymer transport system component
MGEVYRARDTRLDRAVALKVLPPADAAASAGQFAREARAISQLNHPHICTLYDVGEAPLPGASGPPARYLVMELVDGETLAQLLTRGPLPLSRALIYAAQIADALARAHRTGIIHGDLKPANIMVTRAGVKLLDFGLATTAARADGKTWVDEDTGATNVANPGMVTGTLQYLAPEKLEGGPSTERSDIFACGAVIYEMITGRKAFEGDTPAAVIAAILRHDPPPLASARPETPAMLDHVVLTCLARDPEQRWQNAADLSRELTWISRDGLHPEPPAPSRRWRSVAVAVAAAVAIVAALAAMYARRPERRLPVARTTVLLPEGLRFPVAAALGGIGRFALSPNGRQLAFVAVDGSGNQMVWVRALDTLEPKPLPGTDGGSSPFWAPDSRTIAFFAQGQLKTVDLDGGAPLVVASPAFNATGAWFGDTILFTPAPNAPLHRVQSTGGTATPVTALDTANGDILHRSPFFLPDGRHFLYIAVAARTGGQTGPRGVFVGSLAGGEARAIADTGSTAKYAAGRLIFLRENTLVAQPFDPDRLTLSGEPRPIAEQVELTSPGSATFSVSADGTLAYQTSSGSGSQLVWFDREGHQTGIVGEAAQYGDIELSPDGRQAAVSILDPVVNTRDLWIVDLARGVRTRLTSDKAEDIAPVWSPDGTRVVFASNRSGHFDLYERAASGIGAEMPVLQNALEKYPASWSKAARALLFWTFSAGQTGLSTLMPDGDTTAKSFLGSPVNQGAFSPDGRWVMYYSGESGRSEVYVVPFPNPARRWQISTAGGSYSRWRLDGREVFYAGRNNMLTAVSVTARGDDLEVGTPRPLFEARRVGRGNFYDIAPDGEHVLLNTLREQDASATITLVQNWTAALQP